MRNEVNVVLNSEDVDILFFYEDYIMSHLPKSDQNVYDGHEFGPFDNVSKGAQMKLMFYPKTDAQAKRLASKLRTLLSNLAVTVAVSLR